MQQDGWGPPCSPSVSDLGHGNGVAVSDVDTMEIEVLGAPVGAGMVQTPGDAPGKGGPLGLIFRVFFEVCGDKHAMLCRREALPH